MILRDRRSTSYDLAPLFRGRRCTLGGVEKSGSALVRGRQLCTQLSEVSQNCFVFDVVNFEN